MVIFICAFSLSAKQDSGFSHFELSSPLSQFGVNTQNTTSVFPALQQTATGNRSVNKYIIMRNVGIGLIAGGLGLWAGGIGMYIGAVAYVYTRVASVGTGLAALGAVFSLMAELPGILALMYAGVLIWNFGFWAVFPTGIVLTAVGVNLNKKFGAKISSFRDDEYPSNGMTYSLGISL